MIKFNDTVFRSNVQVNFKCLHECVTDISMPIDRLTSAVTRGAMSNKFKLTSIKNCCHNYNFLYACPKLWNLLPNNVTILSTLNIFMTAVDAFTLSHYSVY